MDGTKRVVKNTIIMYVRMVVLMLISFYASRELLAILGVEDYGLYSVVGSVAATFSALKSLFSEAIQRYLNNQKGIGSLGGQRSVFSIGLIIHILLAIVFIVVVEVFGLWLLYNKLNIPDDKFYTAFIALQLTIIFTAISIVSIPFDAVIIANEKMDIFAALSIIDGFYRLFVVVIVLPNITNEKLITYCYLLLLIPISTLVFQSLYCKRFEECRFIRNYDKTIFKEIASLSTWNFMGNICFSLVHEGINVLLNMFGGLSLNTARAIAYKVKTLSGQITHNTVVAVRPRIMQNAAISSKEYLFENIIMLSRISFFLMLLPVVPLMVYCYQLLDIWLVSVPDYSALFSRLIMLGVLIRSLHEPLNMLYMTVAKIKRMMFIEVVVMCLFFAIIYFVLKAGFSLWMAFLILAIMEIVIIVSLVVNAKYEIGFSVRLYLHKVLLPSFIVTSVMVGIGCFGCIYLVPISSFQTLLYSALYLLITIIVVFMALDNKERKIVKHLIEKK